MSFPLQLTVRNVRRTRKLEESVADHAAKLDQARARVSRCQVMLEHEGLHKRRGSIFRVRISLHVPDHELTVDREHDENPYVALRDAFDALERKLKGLAQKRRVSATARSPRRRPAVKKRAA